uniref:acetyl-CoA carboxylase beta subunit n=1 Tax=Ligustrum sinense TaxID=126438 RepID=UPI00233E63C4|nr:acetyl-CoA carboxylase beta subunit [Ligustrum sinense]WBU94113.1 acetyl-CoA carboxylase beta subunit [Ligustrum sinense]
MDQNFIYNPTFLVRDSYGYFYFISFDIENQTVEIENDHPYLTYLSELEKKVSSSQNNESTSENIYSWENYLNSRIHSYLQSQIYGDTSVVSDSSDSDFQYPIYLDTSIVSDSSDSDLQSPIYIDTSDSSDSDLQSPIDIDIDTSDSSDSDLKYPIYIDTSDSSDSDSDLQSPSPIDLDLDASIASIRDRLERYRQSTGTSIVSDDIDSDFKAEIQSAIEAVIASIRDRLNSDLQSPIDIDIDTSDSSDSDLQSPIDIDIDTSDSSDSDSDLQSPIDIDIDTSDSSDSDSDLQSPIDIDIDTSDSSDSDSDLQSPIDIDIDTSDSSDSDSDLQSPSPIDFDFDASIASLDEKIARSREATGTYHDDLKAEIRRDMDAIFVGLNASLDSVVETILNPPIVSDSSDSDSDSDLDDSDSEGSNDDPDTQGTKKFKHLWVLCENETCESLNYKRLLKERLYICEFCGYHLKVNSSDRIEFSIDPDTWHPMDEDLFSLDPIGWHSKKHPYKDRIASDQKDTGLTEAIQTGRGKLNGIPVAIGVMDFRFVGGSMGYVVGEKITRLIEYATYRLLPLIIVCSSGGARMQEGSVSLMQMAKISSALYEYQSNKELFYVSILASPTTGGVLASFGMLGDIIIAEPNAYIAFAGKRVIEQTLNIIIPEGSQETENLFEKGLFDLIVPRKPLKSVLSELLNFHAFFPWNEKRPLLLPLNEKPPLLLPLNATLEHTKEN